MSEPTFAVGIDLGTTHCALAVARLERPQLAVVDIPQSVAAGEVARRPLLPSFLYLAAPGEISPAERRLPWGNEGAIVGELARRLGAKTPQRLVASAKSWICHGGVNRRAPILPWGAPDDEPHISPFAAQVAYLEHLRRAWEHEHAPTRLAEQDVVVTVPASFDESARELTTAAAQAAGLGEIRLIEEPQAAFYDFLGTRAEAATAALADARLVLVIDVGGGTTDLTLLRVHPDAREDGPRIERIAVGGHLMLGGDNMDAALASHALGRAQMARPTDAAIWSAVLGSARHAKERLLSADAPAEVTLSVQGKGSRLLGNTRSVAVERAAAHSVVLDGFFPLTNASEVGDRSIRAGLTTLGLPYTTDTAVPRHVCTFLRRHAEAAREAGADVIDGLPRPDAVLLNGGVFKARACVERIEQVFARWYGADRVRMLDPTSLDTAVARGAVRSILGRRGLGELIGGGTARAYFIGIEGHVGAPEGLCVAPRDMADGTTLEVPDRVLELWLDRPVSFPLFAYTGDVADPPGTVRPIDSQLEPLPALQTVLRGKARTSALGSRIPVTLTASVSDTGALSLHLVTVELPPTRWRLEFAAAVPDPPTASARPNTGPTPPHPATPEGVALLKQTFASAETAAVKSLRASLERRLGPRGQWSAATCRAIADACLEVADDRARTELHELNWLRMLGFALRPGFGMDGDDARIDALWSVRDAGLQNRTKANWVQWWITWRQVAPGLASERQRALFDDVSPWLWKDVTPPPAGPHAHGPIEMMHLLGALERIGVEAKRRAGTLVVERAPGKLKSYWPLGRIGARALFHGEVSDVVPPEVAEGWLRTVLELDWTTADGAAFAAASLARATGDPARDVDADLRTRVAEALTKAGSPASWIDMVARPSDLSARDLTKVLGDSLPLGLRLA